MDDCSDLRSCRRNTELRRAAQQREGAAAVATGGRGRGCGGGGGIVRPSVRRWELGRARPRGLCGERRGERGRKTNSLARPFRPSLRRSIRPSVDISYKFLPWSMSWRMLQMQQGIMIESPNNVQGVPPACTPGLG